MTAKQRHKNNSSDKNSSSNQDDVAKKSPKPSERGNPPVSGSGSGSLAKLLSATCYLALVAAAGIAAFYLQTVLEEVGQIRKSNEESAQKNFELSMQMEMVLQKVDSMKEAVGGFDSALGIMRAELDGAGRALRKSEAETRRIEEALQKLQKEILLELSDGIRDVKEAREQDFSSLERAVEERLTELSRSIGDSVAEVADVQGKTQGQLQELRARLENIEVPSLFRQELLATNSAVAELQEASRVAEKATQSLTEQIGAVGAELETRNQEVASTALEIVSVRELVQSTAGILRQSLSAVEASVQALSDQTLSLQVGFDRAESGLHSLQKDLWGVKEQAETGSEDMEARLKAVEGSTDAFAASLAEQLVKLESVLSKYDSHESKLASLARDAESHWSTTKTDIVELQASFKDVNSVHQALGSQVEVLKSQLGELESTVSTIGRAHTELSLLDTSQRQQLEGLEQRVDDLGDAIKKAQASDDVKATLGQAQKDMQQLRAAVDSLVAYSVKIEEHQEAITTLQSELEETRTSVGALSKSQKA